MKWIGVLLLMGKIVSAQTERYTVIINEIMVDPSPVVGLPNAEYIELRNCSNRSIDLYKWKIEKGSSVYSIGNSTILKPDSIILLCSKTNLPFFNPSVRVVAMSTFPTLTNDEGTITLKSADNSTIHAIEYKNSWHENSIKAAGGWSLEMINPLQPCENENWTSSVHRNGGTPGTENSVYKNKISPGRFEALQCTTLNDQTLLIQFSFGADSSTLSNALNYSIRESTLGIISVKVIGTLFNKAEIKVQSPLKPNCLYFVDVKNILSCKKDKSFETTVQTGLQKDPLPKDILVNEILFNPPSDGSDFIELYNNTQSVINAEELYLSSYNNLGGLNSSYKIGDGNFNFFPKDYLVITEDTAFVKRQWPSAISKKMIQVKNLPSLPDDAGNIILMNKQGTVLDKMNYSDNMHYPFLRDASGVSLERIQVDASSENKTTWHSASSTVHYATPTLENSQHKKRDSTQSHFEIESKILSPNNDGVNDVLDIRYHFDRSGYACSVYLFGLQGNLIGKIIDNKLLGTSGSILWDGLNNGQVLPFGQYIIYAEAFHLQSKSVKAKILIAIR
jgi:hypothetical protein